MRILLSFIVMIHMALPAAALDIKEVTSPGGIKAWLVNEPSIPFTALQIIFRGGASLDREGKRGAGHLMSGLLEEGAGDLDASAFAARTEELAAQFSFDIYDDSLMVSARFLTENRDASVDLLRQALSEPRFDQSAIDRVRAQVLSIIASKEKEPGDLAAQNFNALAYGDHPYGSDYVGSKDSVEGLSRDDIVTAHRDILVRDRVYIGAVGDITAEELGVLLDKLLGDLPEADRPLPQQAEFLLEGGETVVPFDTPQSVVLFGHTGIKRDDPDFFAAYVMNHAFGGGGFGSRLMDELREKRGLTYGIGTHLVNKKNADLMLGQVASSNETTAQAIAMIREQWADIAQNGIQDEELETAKTYLTGAYPLRFDGNGPIARILAGMQFDGLPMDYIDTRNDKVDAVTQEDIKRVAARLMKPDQLHFVVVGQPEGLGEAQK